MKPETLVKERAPGAGSGLSQEVWLHSVMNVKETRVSWDGQGRRRMNQFAIGSMVGGNRAGFSLQKCFR